MMDTTKIEFLLSSINLQVIKTNIILSAMVKEKDLKPHKKDIAKLAKAEKELLKRINEFAKWTKEVEKDPLKAIFTTWK